jgi:putative thioredoxin
VGIDAGRAIDLSGIVSRSSSPAGHSSAASAKTLNLPGLALQADEATFSTVIEISDTVPVVVCFVRNVDTDEPMIHTLTNAITEMDGKVVLVSVDAEANPQLASSFRADMSATAPSGPSPVVAAIIGGRPLPLFAGAQPAEVVAQILQQLVAVGAQNGVDGVVTVPAENTQASAQLENESGPGSGASGDAVDSLAPLHREAFDAIEAGDYATAMNAYERAIVENPRDDMARAGLAQVSLLHRLAGMSLSEVRNAAAANPTDVTAVLNVADLDISGGHIEDAFERLLALFVIADTAERDVIRARLLQLFEVVGAADARVIAARSRLSSLLY